MPRSYAAQLRAMVIEQVRTRRRVADVASAVEVSEATVYRWVRQDDIDRGELIGTSTPESAELRTAKRRIAELESELSIVKRSHAVGAGPGLGHPVTEEQAGKEHPASSGPDEPRSEGPPGQACGPTSGVSVK